MGDRRESGITLVEMMAVIAIIGLIVGITFPAIGAGLEAIRLVSAADSTVAFINAGLNRAERRQQAVEITVSSQDNSLSMVSTEPGFTRSLELPPGIMIVRVHPLPPDGSEQPVRRFYLFPAGTVPRVGIELANKRGSRRIVRIDPATGVADIERGGPEGK
jgi:prepilin-type N-terminal cleavage/methylation domain-containing protein